MTATSKAASDLRWTMRLSVATTELQHAQVQLRLIAALLAGSMLFDLVDPALLLLAQAESLVTRAAAGSALGAQGLGLLFAVLAAELVPFLTLQLGWCTAQRRDVTKATCLVLAAVGLTWLFLAWRCTHLGLGATAQIVFVRNGAGALIFALALGLSLNAELLRSYLDRPE